MMLKYNTLQSLIDWVYPNVQAVECFSNFFRDRAILAPQNQDVDEINDITLCCISGVDKDYLAVPRATIGRCAFRRLPHRAYLVCLFVTAGHLPQRL